jgi:hypothetical protein
MTDFRRFKTLHGDKRLGVEPASSQIKPYFNIDSPYGCQDESVFRKSDSPRKTLSDTKKIEEFNLVK